MNDWKLKVWKQKKMFTFWSLVFLFDLFDCYDTVCMIQDENVGIHFNFGFHHFFIEDFDCFFFSFSQYNFFVGFLKRVLVLFSFFIFGCNSKKKQENTSRHKRPKRKPTRTKKKLIAFHSAHAHMCDDCLWWLLTAFDEIRWNFFSYISCNT